MTIATQCTNQTFLFDLFSPFLPSSWAGARHHTSGVVFPVHHVMPSSGGAVGTLWYVPFGGGSSGLNSSTSWGSRGACVASQPVDCPASSRRGSSPWTNSTRCSPPSGSTTGRWCVGPNVTRWDFLIVSTQLNINTWMHLLTVEKTRTRQRHFINSRSLRLYLSGVESLLPCICDMYCGNNI